MAHAHVTVATNLHGTAGAALTKTECGSGAGGCWCEVGDGGPTGPQKKHKAATSDLKRPD